MCPSQREEGSASSVGELSQASRAPSPLSGAWEVQRRSPALLSLTFHYHLVPRSGALERAEQQHCPAPPPFAPSLAAAQEAPQVRMPPLHLLQHLRASKILALGLIPCFPTGKRIISSP